MLRPYIRKYNYIEDYFYTVYDHYVKHYPSFPVVYYSTDTQYSIMDDETHTPATGSTGLMGENYEKNGVGEYSGKKFRKIYMFPVHRLDTIQPTMDSGDKGFTALESLVTRFEFPDAYGLKPIPGDTINLNYGMDSPNKPKNDILYNITNYSTAHHGDYLTVYQLNAKVAPYDVNEIEKQISSVWAFYEPTKTIIPVSNASVLNKLLKKINVLSKNLNLNIHPQSNVYFQQKDVIE